MTSLDEVTVVALRTISWGVSILSLGWIGKLDGYLLLGLANMCLWLSLIWEGKHGEM